MNSTRKTNSKGLELINDRKSRDTTGSLFKYSKIMSLVHFISYEETHSLAGKVYLYLEEEPLKLFPFADIQHIGSTSIPGSLSKGDIDINVRIKPENFKEVVSKLKELYEVNQPENWTGNFASFKDDKNYDLPVGIQLTIIDSPDDFFVEQRDRLIQNKKLLDELNKLKQQYEGKTMEEYRKVKSEFFEKLRS